MHLVAWGDFFIIYGPDRYYYIDSIGRDEAGIEQHPIGWACVAYVCTVLALTLVGMPPFWQPSQTLANRRQQELKLAEEATMSVRRLTLRATAMMREDNSQVVAEGYEEAKDEEGRTALHRAAGNGQVEALQHLLSAEVGAELEAKDEEGRTA
eukprot:COSAG01_NODE_291_length_19378_cov_38.136418_1_plen_152_part_10